MHHKKANDPIDWPIEAFTPNIGKRVRKISGKPFKSGAKVATVAGVVVHKQMQRPAYTFAEDDSEVECWRCVLD